MRDELVCVFPLNSLLFTTVVCWEGFRFNSLRNKYVGDVDAATAIGNQPPPAAAIGNQKRASAIVNQPPTAAAIGNQRASCGYC